MHPPFKTRKLQTAKLQIDLSIVLEIEEDREQVDNIGEWTELEGSSLMSTTRDRKSWRSIIHYSLWPTFIREDDLDTGTDADCSRDLAAQFP